MTRRGLGDGGQLSPQRSVARLSAIRIGSLRSVGYPIASLEEALPR
jgi:hypothetical protein